ncbi:hypothetical protein A6R68_20973 [Neotoma lepida]|uniref:Uncharacterized protein n=1 Tax=Neotoma lepida TaxID=56216 RepID=A0A1A6HQV7_NEOLE|nr:hypothetical protein A6R68_20973 [Neotoma lepida]
MDATPVPKRNPTPEAQRFRCLLVFDVTTGNDTGDHKPVKLPLEHSGQAQVRPRASCLLFAAPEPLAHTLGLAVVQYLWLRCAKPGTLESGLDALPPSLSVGPMLTFPGNTVPTDGEMVMGELGGTKNSKDVGPTGAASSDPIRGKEWVSLFMLRIADENDKKKLVKAFKKLVCNGSVIVHTEYGEVIQLQQYQLQPFYGVAVVPEKGPPTRKQLLGDGSSAVAPEEQSLGTSPSEMSP